MATTPGPEVSLDQHATALLAEALRDKSLMLLDLGRLAEALAVADEAVATFATLGPSSALSVPLQATYARVLICAAAVRASGPSTRDSASAMAAAAVAIRERLAEDDPVEFGAGLTDARRLLADLQAE